MLLDTESVEALIQMKILSQKNKQKYVDMIVLILTVSKVALIVKKKPHK